MNEVSKVIVKNLLLQKRSPGQLIATNNIYRKTRLVVYSGPFKGLKYVQASSGGAYFPKLLGIYEKELHSVLDKVKDIPFSHIINVGGGEGYYTGGLAMLFKHSPVVTYEPSFNACYLMDQLCKKNNLQDRVTIKAKLCFPEDLEHELSLSTRPLVFMDVEGFEQKLLDPKLVRGLEKASVIVEVHDNIKGLGDDLRAFLEPTHQFNEIMEESRSVNDIPYNGFWRSLLKKSFNRVISEGRGYKMRWFYFEPKN